MSNSVQKISRTKPHLTSTPRTPLPLSFKRENIVCRNLIFSQRRSIILHYWNDNKKETKIRCAFNVNETVLNVKQKMDKGKKKKKKTLKQFNPSKKNTNIENVENVEKWMEWKRKQPVILALVDASCFFIS